MNDRKNRWFHRRVPEMVRIASAAVMVALATTAPIPALAQTLPLVLKEHRAGTVLSVAVSSDGRTVIAADAGTRFVGAFEADRKTIAWDARTGVVLGRFESECDTWDLAFLPDGKHFLAAQEDGDLILRETRAGRILGRFRGHVGRVMAIDVVPDGRRAVSCGIDGSVRLWDPRTGEQLHAFVDPEPTLLTCVRIDEDGRRVIAGGLDGVLRVYDLERGTGPRRLPGHTDQINTLAWLPEGRALSGGRDRTIRTWDVELGRLLDRIEAGTDVTALVASPGGRRALFGGIDGLVHLRDVDLGRDLSVMKGHTSWIWDIRVPDTGRFAASCGQDGTVRLWPLGPEDVDPRSNLGARRRAPGRPSGGRRGSR